MTQEEFLRKLLSPKARNPSHSTGPRKFAWMRDSETNQLVKVPLSEVKAGELGAFTGRAGTMRRSSKGRTYRLPNGRRKFVQDWGSTIVSYKA